MTGTVPTSPFLARVERFAVVGSTNDIVRRWLADGSPEVCLATADAQTAGRGRDGRRWVAPTGGALLLSLGFRPRYLAPDRVWRLAAVTALAVAEAAERVAGLPAGRIRLKWPNDLVVETGSGGIRKLAGLLGETDGLGTDDPQVVVGLGINTTWAAADFPADLTDTMTSLSELATGDGTAGAFEPDDLLATFLARLEIGVRALREEHFDRAAWAARQVTTGRTVRLERPDGRHEDVRATGVDPESGALLVDDGRAVVVGEITHVRFADPVTSGV